MSGESIHKIELLRGAENYLIWRRRELDALEDQDLDAYIQAKGPKAGTTRKITIPAPTADDPSATKEKTETVTAAEEAEWKKKDRKALRHIRARVAENVAHYVLNADSAYDAWQILEKEFYPQGFAAVIRIHLKLADMKQLDGADMEEHVRNVQSLQTELATLGKPVPDEFISAVLIASLPPSWGAFASSLDLTDPDKIKSSSIRARILEEERRLKAISNAETAMFAKRTKPKDNRHSTKPKSRANDECRYCKKRGHWERDCRAKKADQKKNENANTATEKASATSEKANLAVTTGENGDRDFEFSFVAEETGNYAHTATTGPNVWIGDSGASVHVVTDRRFFETYRNSQGTLAGVGSQPIVGRGDVKISMEHNGEAHTVTLRDAVHVPGLPYNLVSLARITQNAAFEVRLGNKLEIVHKKDNKIIASGERKGNLYYINAIGIEHEIALTAVTYEKAHKALGHQGMKTIKRIVEKGLVKGLKLIDKIPEKLQCIACIKGMQTRNEQPKIAENAAANDIGAIVTSDVWGGGSRLPLGFGGAKYLVTFTDLYSRLVTAYPIKEKTEVLTRFEHFYAFVRTQTGKEIKAVRVDGGGEYTSNLFKLFCAEKGIRIEYTAPHSPAQNGISERLNRTLMDHVRAIMQDADLPPSMWPIAAEHFIWIKNRSPTTALKEDVTPYEKFFGRKPRIAHLEPWGTKVWVLDQRNVTSKIAPRSRQFRFVGYTEDPEIIRYWDGRKILTTRNFVFESDGNVAEKCAPTSTTEQPKAAGEYEHEFSGNEYAETPGTQEAPAPDMQEAQIPNILPDQEPDYDMQGPDPENEGFDIEPEQPEPEEWLQPNAPENDPEDQVPEPRSSSRLREKPRLDYNVLNKTGKKVPKGNRVNHAFDDDDEPDPSTVEEARGSKHAQDWIAAMDRELEQLRQKGTFTQTRLPKGRTAIGCRWVFATKRDAQGRVIKRKARLVGKGFAQRKGFDYMQTFSPVMRGESFRIIIALAAKFGWELDQVDVVGAYLNGVLPEGEDVYMEQPPGYDDGSGLVLKLNKALYGLKQAGRVWNQQLNKFLLETGWKRLISDQCIYIRRRNGTITVLAVHVDDMAIGGDSIAEKDLAKAELASKFEITDMGPLRTIVGLEVSRDRNNGTITLSQGAYIRRVLKKFNMDNANPVTTPLDISANLTKPDPNATAANDVPYAELIGSLMYAAICTRPDISFAVGLLSRFTANPEHRHWNAAKRVLRYLAGNPDKGITFGGKGDTRATGYSDADFAGDEITRKSVSGFLFWLLGPISWMSKQEPITAVSTMDSEYVALSHATREAIWLRTFLNELGFPQEGPTEINVDNRPAIELAHDGKFHSRAKHIDIKHHHIRDHINLNNISVDYIRSEDNLADVFTKGLPRDRHASLTSQFMAS